jgi:hypothetical protein
MVEVAIPVPGGGTEQPEAASRSLTVIASEALISACDTRAECDGAAEKALSGQDAVVIPQRR